MNENLAAVLLMKEARFIGKIQLLCRVSLSKWWSFCQFWNTCRQWKDLIFGSEPTSWNRRVVCCSCWWAWSFAVALGGASTYLFLQHCCLLECWLWTSGDFSLLWGLLHERLAFDVSSYHRPVCHLVCARDCSWQYVVQWEGWWCNRWLVQIVFKK